MKLKNLFKYGIISFITTVVMFGCNSEEPNVPRSLKYVSATENFEIKSFENNSEDFVEDSLDFSLDSMKFNAEFNEEVTWTITITGNSHSTDHAERIIQGTSISISSDEIFWDGASDNVYFFKKKEPVTIELSILGSDKKVVWSNYIVSQTKKFNSNVILNFDGEGALLNDGTADVNLFFDTENKFEGLDSGKFFTREDLPTSVQGNGYAYVRGIDLVGEPSSFFIGGLNNNPKNFGITSSVEETYFNMYANSNGNKTTKIVVLIEGIGGDKFKTEKNVIWDGWRLVSVRLSDFVLGEAGALGPGILFPDQIKRFNIEIHSGDGAGKEAELLVDYICFTVGTPFRQSN